MNNQIYDKPQAGGEYGHTVNVIHCPVCNRLTNLMYKRPDGKLIVACCQQCANQR